MLPNAVMKLPDGLDHDFLDRVLFPYPLKVASRLKGKHKEDQISLVLTYL